MAAQYQVAQDLPLCRAMVPVMDRGIPTEADLDLMRQSDPPIHYLVGTPKGRLSHHSSLPAEVLGATLTSDRHGWYVPREPTTPQLLTVTHL